ncbi:amidohydrolase family protein [Sphingomonas sp. CJ20]
MKIRMMGILLGAGLLAAAAGGSLARGPVMVPVAQEAVLALTHATVFDPGRQGVIRDATIIVADGRIRAVGPGATVKVPTGARIEDLRGKFVMPGIIDNHVHLGLVDGISQDLKNYTRENVERQLRTYAAYGVTSVQVLGTDKDIIHDIVRNERQTTPDMARVWTAGRGVVFKGSYGGVAGLEQSVATPAEAKAMVDREVAKGVDVVKLWMDDELGTIAERMPYPIAKAVVDEAHAKGKKAVAHIFYLDNARTLAREHIDGFGHAVRDQPIDAETLRLMKANNVMQVAATLSREASFTYDLLPFVDEPFFSRGVAPSVVADLKSEARRNRLRSSPSFAKYPGILDNALANFGRQARAGIAYGMGTDSGPSARFPGYFAHWELALMVRAGVTPRAALTAATLTNARWLGATDLGRVVPGYRADLLVLDRDPLADIQNTRSIRSVLIGGRSVPTIWQSCAGRPADACPAEPR